MSGPPTPSTEAQVLKRNRRLIVLFPDGTAYVPPDFIRHLIKSREQLQPIADATDRIAAIMEFEGSIR